MAIDYSLYLVTDSTQSILDGKDLVQVVQQALEGGAHELYLICAKSKRNAGATIVQYRDKSSDTRRLISMAEKLHTVTERFGVPLIINDRVDVALAIGAEGVHIGQEDMSYGICLLGLT